MPKSDRTSESIAKIAGHVLKTGSATPTEAKKLAASALTQAPPKKKGK
jgi:hypothetical protein